MAPKLILVRHAQALHNVGQDYTLPDPGLSDLGVEQCAELQAYLRQECPPAHAAELIVTSPMRRTLQTTQLSLGWLIGQGVPVLPRAEWQGIPMLLSLPLPLSLTPVAENSSKPCDTGSDIDEMKKEFPQFDFSSVDMVYPKKTGVYAYTQAAVLKRGELATAWLKSRRERIIIVVTHSAFLRTSVAHRRFANADFRISSFSDEVDSLELIEDQSTVRGGLGRSDAGTMTWEEGDFPDAEEELEQRPVQ